MLFLNSTIQHLSFIVPLITLNCWEVCYDNFGCFHSNYNFIDTNPSVLLPEEPAKINTTFTIYNRVLINGESITSRSFDHYNDLQTKFIIHGALNTALNSWVLKLKDALLKAENVNVITIDWSDGNRNLYAVPNTQIVGIEIGKLIHKMIENKNTNLDGNDFHLIGHSLGAHAAGYTGQFLKRNNNIILARITGLDPAGPYFTGALPEFRLDPSDANFVDVIHSDASDTLGFGIYQPSGHVDFYPNGGEKQPDCPARSGKVIKGVMHGIFSGFNGLRKQVACSHGASVKFYTDSILTNCQYTAYPCKSIEEFNQGKCIKCPENGCNQMGYYASLTKNFGSLFLNTNSLLEESNFCQKTFQINLISVNIDDDENKQAKGQFLITLKTENKIFSDFILDEDETIFEKNSIFTKLLAINEINDIKDIQSVRINYTRMTLGLYWYFEEEWSFSKVEIFHGDTQEMKKFCPEEKTQIKSGDSMQFNLC